MFVLLFAVVFGGAIILPGYEDNPNAYREFLMPGIFAQNIVFAAGITAIGMTDDVGKGIIDRFRSLPMARSAVPDRSIAQRCRLQRRHPRRPDAVRAVRRLDGQHRAVADCWPGSPCACCSPSRCRGWASTSGLNVPTVEVANQVIFTVLFPITFLSNAFVAVETLPTWLQPVAEWNPTSTLTSSLRELWGNPTARSDRQHPVAVPDPRDARAGSSSSSRSSRRWASASTGT